MRLIREIFSLLARVRKLEVTVANEVEDLKAVKASIDQHNADDKVFQDTAQKAIADLQGKVADLQNANQGVDLTALDAAIADVKDAVAAQPALALA